MLLLAPYHWDAKYANYGVWLINMDAYVLHIKLHISG